MRINERIKKLREDRGFSQKEVADYLDVDQSFISRVESGERSLTSDMLNKIASLFGVVISAIVSGDSKISTTEYSFRTSGLSGDDMKTISVINKIALNSSFMSELLGEQK